MALTRQHDFYTGRGGQLAVMAQFLRRGYNAAIPQIDNGEDIFVIKDDNGEMTRVQVKAATNLGTQGVYGTFGVSRAQLERPRLPDLWYVFTIFHEGLWRDFLLIRRDILHALHVGEGIGRESKKKVISFYIAYHADDVRCGGVSLQAYRMNWEPWQFIQH
jgi:hypothetical protein